MIRPRRRGDRAGARFRAALWFVAALGLFAAALMLQGVLGLVLGAIGATGAIAAFVKLLVPQIKLSELFQSLLAP